jgi:hypothetical protein
MGGWVGEKNKFPHFFFLSLAPQPSLGLGLLHKIRLNFLEASQQFSFYRVGFLAPRPTPHPGGPNFLTEVSKFAQGVSRSGEHLMGLN